MFSDKLWIESIEVNCVEVFLWMAKFAWQCRVLYPMPYQLRATIHTKTIFLQYHFYVKQTLLFIYILYFWYIWQNTCICKNDKFIYSFGFGFIHDSFGFFSAFGPSGLPLPKILAGYAPGSNQYETKQLTGLKRKKTGHDFMSSECCKIDCQTWKPWKLRNLFSTCWTSSEWPWRNLTAKHFTLNDELGGGGHFSSSNFFHFGKWGGQNGPSGYAPGSNQWKTWKPWKLRNLFSNSPVKDAI